MLQNLRTVHHQNIPPIALPPSEQDARKLLTDVTIKALDASHSASTTPIVAPVATAVRRLEQVLDEDGVAWERSEEVEIGQEERSVNGEAIDGDDEVTSDDGDEFDFVRSIFFFFDP
jgi:hypothetical protein